MSYLLYINTMNTKKNLWQVSIQPLCEFLLPLSATEPAESWIKRVGRTIRCSFKCFTGLAFSAPDKLVDELCGYDFENRCQLIKWLASEKWAARCERRRVNMENMPLHIRTDRPANLCRRMSKELATYINLSKSMCKKCTVPNTACHLQRVHGVSLPTWEDLVNMIKEAIKGPKMSRKKQVTKARGVLKTYLDKYQGVINRVEAEVTASVPSPLTRVVRSNEVQNATRGGRRKAVTH